MKFAKVMAVLALLAVAVSPASAQLTDIDTIQLYTDTGANNSPLDGLPVTVRGVITAVKGTYNSGTHYIQDATGGINFFDPAAPTFAIGDEVEVSGTVASFSGEINISGPFTYTFIGTSTPPAPLVLTAAEFLDNDGSGTLNSADYEILGTLAQITGTVAFRTIDNLVPGPGAQGTFSLVGAPGDTLQVFIDSTTGIDTSGLSVGAEYQITAPVSVFASVLQLKPRFQTDLVFNPGNPFPVIVDVTPSPWAPVQNQAITVSADISDNTAITSASLYYRDLGATTFNQVPLSNLGGSSYSGLIPGTTAAGVEYYIEATDDTGQTSTLPGDAPNNFLAVAVGTTSIKVIQSTLQAGGDASAFSGQRVNIEGIITSAPGELQTNGFSNYSVGEADGGAWSGVFIFEGSGGNILFRGDRVRIAGTVSEFNGITEVVPLNAQAVELVSFGNPLPPLPVLSTSLLDTTEAWESVIVATPRAAVVDTVLAGLEWQLKDAASDSSIYIDPAPAVSIVGVLGDEMYVTGLLDTRFGRNEIVPRDDGDIVLASAVSAPGLPSARQARFESIAPNPFNPATEIKFAVPANGRVELVVFDSRGRRVNTLISGDLEAGTHTKMWNGRDDSGEEVSSGVYYARLRFEAQSVAVEKLTLTK